MKTQTLITCWSCTTTYDYQRHEVCPTCDKHFLDVSKRRTRISVTIDYNRGRLIPVARSLCVMLILVLASCSAFVHAVPDNGDFYVTRNDTCVRDNVVLKYKQDVFASKISLTYRSSRDTLVLKKLFRQHDANTYSDGVTTVTLGAGQIVRIQNDNNIVVDYRCH